MVKQVKEPNPEYLREGRLLKAAMKTAGVKQQDIADERGVEQNLISQWCTGKTRVPDKDLLWLGTRLTFNPYLVRKSLREYQNYVQILDNNVDPVKDPEKRVPLISLTQAGDFCEAVDPYEPNDAENWMRSPFETGERDFLLRIRGDSMDDGTPGGYPDGCIAHFNPSIEPRHKDDVVVRTPDNQTTFKQLHLTDEGAFLVPRNPSYQNRLIEMPEDTVICAVCVGHWMPKRR